jgi:hypothetical protein
MRATETPSKGLQRAPGWDSVHLQNFFRQNMRVVVDSQYGPTTVSAESLIAQLHSQGKLTTPSRENRKIRHKIEILKANEHASYV